jgi:hypothetical protein
MGSPGLGAEVGYEDFAGSREEASDGEFPDAVSKSYLDCEPGAGTATGSSTSVAGMSARSPLIEGFTPRPPFEAR